MSDLPALMAIRVQGVSPPERLGLALAVPPEDAVIRAKALCEARLTAERTVGRICGFALTPSGITALSDELTSEGLAGDDALGEQYGRFCILNERFLRVASDWQVRRHGPIEVANDHADPDYDQAVIDRLAEVHDRARVIVGRMADRAMRLDPYRGRLDHCLARVLDHDRSAFTAALAESYHTVWFELHQDLILTLGAERTV